MICMKHVYVGAWACMYALSEVFEEGFTCVSICCCFNFQNICCCFST